MSAPIKLLLVEDDPNLGSLLAEYLRAKGYTVDLRTDGQQGWLAYKDGKYGDAVKHLNAMLSLTPAERLRVRYEKFRRYGSVTQREPAAA